MAAFVDSLVKLALLLAQVISSFAIGQQLHSIKRETAQREKNFDMERRKHNDWLKESGHPSEWLAKSIERYIPDYRKVKRSRIFWNNGGGNFLFAIYLVLQFIACALYFSLDFASGLR